MLFLDLKNIYILSLCHKMTDLECTVCFISYLMCSSRTCLQQYNSRGNLGSCFLLILHVLKRKTSYCVSMFKKNTLLSVHAYINVCISVFLVTLIPEFEKQMWSCCQSRDCCGSTANWLNVANERGSSIVDGGDVICRRPMFGLVFMRGKSSRRRDKLLYTILHTPRQGVCGFIPVTSTANASIYVSFAVSSSLHLVTYSTCDSSSSFKRYTCLYRLEDFDRPENTLLLWVRVFFTCRIETGWLYFGPEWIKRVYVFCCKLEQL